MVFALNSSGRLICHLNKQIDNPFQQLCWLDTLKSYHYHHQLELTELVSLTLSLSLSLSLSHTHTHTHTQTHTLYHCPVGWGCRIHQLLLYRGVTSPRQNECPRYDSNPGTLWNAGYAFIALAPRSTSRVVAPVKGPIYGLNRTKAWFLDFTVFCIETAYLY